MQHLYQSQRDAMVEKHLSYAHAIAAEVTRTLPRDVDARDVQAAAELGLVEAANAFDSARGVQFQTFAYYRIRGAVYDCLRKMGWLPKSLYDQCRFESAANSYMADYSANPPATRSAAGAYDEAKNLAGSILSCYMISLDAAPQYAPEDARSTPEQSFCEKESAANVRRAIEQLPPRNRQVIEDYYFHDLTLEEIGRKLGLSKSWISRLHAKSVEMMRAVLTATPNLAAPPKQTMYCAPVR